MIINVSRLDEYGTCEEKYKQKFQLGREPFEDESTSARGFGSAIHEAFRALYYRGKWDEKGMLETYRTFWTDTLPAGETHELEGFGERLLGHYVDTYRASDKDWTVLAVETSWAIPLGSKHTLVGRWDMIVKSEIGGGTLFHVQHKTTGASSLDLYARGYDLAWHERAYGAAAKKRWPDLPYGGTILNLVRRPRLGTKKVEPDKDFKRYYVPVDEDSIKRFLRDAEVRTDRIVGSEVTGVWQQNPKACVMYQTICPFHGECLGMPTDEETWSVRSEDYVDLMQKGMTLEKAVEEVERRKLAKQEARKETSE